MKKPLFWTLFVVLLVIGLVLGWLDNGPRNIDVEELPSRFDE